MAGEVKSATEATKIAATFLKTYFGFIRPVSATKGDRGWIVKVDVGVVNKMIAEVDIDESTGEVTNYVLPE